jgi:hypothetical protein
VAASQSAVWELHFRNLRLPGRSGCAIEQLKGAFVDVAVAGVVAEENSKLGPRPQKGKRHALKLGLLIAIEQESTPEPKEKKKSTSER